ncbi:tripartite tricarboxylate transporter TctB family protein [Halalkalibacter okhensis]|uniref:DUF1468 domain-containing protein n=1 Tax=Halalkalibacter okhensis TaxID=333138 RepID=A0A0B0IG31_9BACI|nr:tripartite tricarboxylate transporter TctB family protein [Halalkalibacter okhensis]KHF38631.1 hypothetical protein LQ50_20155 [Halalkalibacter okhensis]
MADNKEVAQNMSNESDVDPSLVQKNPVYELVFLLIVGIAVFIAFISALGYHPVSARAPLVVMAPLILLMAVHGFRLFRATDKAYFKDFFDGIIKRKNTEQVKILLFVGWMLILCGLIYVGGHYIGSALFMFILLYFYGKEKLKTSLLLSIIATIVLYCLFEMVFSIELYRGLIYRYFMGYDVF